jgi:proteasome lid subunit RPN8/RPN11
MVIVATRVLDTLLGELAALAEASPGSEICGFALVGSHGPPRLAPVPNVSPDPARGFEMDPLRLARILGDAERDGVRVVAAYHSHLSGGASLSSRDLEGLTLNGRPVLPGVEIWIVGMQQGWSAEICAYRLAEGGRSPAVRRAAPFTLR